MSQSLVFVGASGHSGLVLGELEQYPQIRLAAYAPSFAGEDMHACERYAAAHCADDPPAVYDDWRAMLDSEQPDIVVICGRYDLNGPVSIEAARRGCHIVSEKPAAQTLAEVNALGKLLVANDLCYAIMLNMRYEPSFFTARRLVAEGAIGEPVLISAQKSYRWGNSRPAWYADRAKYGSSMTWVGIHAFDYARWVSGRTFTSVSAHHANLVRKERSGCQDVSTVMATLDNGGAAVFNLDFLRPETAPTHGDDRLRVAGSEGVIEVVGREHRVHLMNRKGEITDCPLVEPNRTLFGDFVSVLEGRGELLVSSQEALDITRFAVYAAQAADSKSTVEI